MNHNSPSCCCPVGLEREVLGLPCADIPPGTAGLSPEWQHTARLINSISHFNCGSLSSHRGFPPNAVLDIIVPVVSNVTPGFRAPTITLIPLPVCCPLPLGTQKKQRSQKPHPNFGLNMSEGATQQGQGSVEASWDQKSRASEFMGPMDLLSDRRVGVHYYCADPYSSVVAISRLFSHNGHQLTPISSSNSTQCANKEMQHQGGHTVRVPLLCTCS